MQNHEQGRRDALIAGNMRIVLGMFLFVGLVLWWLH